MEIETEVHEISPEVFPIMWIGWVTCGKEYERLVQLLGFKTFGCKPSDDSVEYAVIISDPNFAFVDTFWGLLVWSLQPISYPTFLKVTQHLESLKAKKGRKH